MTLEGIGEAELGIGHSRNHGVKAQNFGGLGKKTFGAARSLIPRISFHVNHAQV